MLADSTNKAHICPLLHYFCLSLIIGLFQHLNAVEGRKSGKNEMFRLNIPSADSHSLFVGISVLICSIIGCIIDCIIGRIIRPITLDKFFIYSLIGLYHLVSYCMKNVQIYLDMFFATAIFVPWNQPELLSWHLGHNLSLSLLLFIIVIMTF